MLKKGLHTFYMREAIRLAEKGRGRVSPNPLVGAIVIQKGKVIGRGAHLFFGGPHAEANALKMAGHKAKGAALYVTLEPCSTWGKTGPCTEAILESGIKQVYIGAKDPNPKHGRRGIRILRKAGIKVKHGILAEEVLKQNVGFVSLMEKKRPYMILKMAQSLDGKISTVKGESKWITSEATRKFVHALRSKVDAVLVGTNTVMHDDPHLTVRNGSVKTNQPSRIILDRCLKIKSGARALNTKSAPIYYATAPKNVSRATSRFASKRVDILGIPEKAHSFNLEILLKEMAKRGVASILVEGGGELAASLLKDKLVDKIYWCVAPIFIGGRGAKTSVEGMGIDRLTNALRLKKVQIHRFKDDIVIEGDL